MPDRSRLQPQQHPEPATPAKLHGLAERRQFGRRTTVWHAWIVTSGPRRTACVVRNLSVTGALLELEVPAWLPPIFTLAIEDRDISIACEVRHRGQHGVGVSFSDPEAGRRLSLLAGKPATGSRARRDDTSGAIGRPRLTPEMLRKTLQSQDD